MDRYSVKVRVGTYLQEFIRKSNGSAVLDPDKNSILWCLVKQHLITLPYTEPIATLPESESIEILMRAGRSASTYNVTSKRNIHIDTLYRCYLDPRGQSIIRKYFEKNMRQIFRTYMIAYTSATEKSIHYAISDFCLEYNITITKSLLERLRKDWYRNRDKTQICPFNY